MLTLDFIRLAEARIRPFVHRTPVATSRTFDELAGRRVFFKCENFQRAGAFKARGAGVRACIVMPEDAPRAKLAATRGYGAEVVLYDRQREDREQVARRLSEQEGLAVVPPFDDYHVIAGQGTCALELFEDVPDLDALLTPCGGGGLFAGASTAARGLHHGIRCF